MCLGLPARVTASAQAGDLVEVQMAGTRRLVNAGLLDVPPAPGEWVLVHLGFALSTMSAAEADEAMRQLAQMTAERTGRTQEGSPW